MFFINTIIDLDTCEFFVKIIERFFDIAIVFLGALLTAKIGYYYWLRQHNVELSVKYRGKYLSSLGEFLNLTQREIELRKDNENNANYKEINAVSLKRASVEYKIDMARIEMNLTKIVDYDKYRIDEVDKMFKDVFVNSLVTYDEKNDKKCTRWKKFTKIKHQDIKPEDIEEIEGKIDKIREYLKNNF